MSSSGRFDDIFNAAKDQESEPAVETKAEYKATKTPKRSSEGGGKSKTKAKEFWSDLEPEEKEATVRLNVDIPISLNDKLAEKARKLRQPKTELVRKLIEWAMTDSSE
jgi:hypothetical protein